MQHAYFLLSKNVWFVFLALRVQDSIGDLVTHSLRHLLTSVSQTFDFMTTLTTITTMTTMTTTAKMITMTTKTNSDSKYYYKDYNDYNNYNDYRDSDLDLN